jgi:ubiquinone/menaquinone biosynthesis C-methylase UbiE
MKLLRKFQDLGIEGRKARQYDEFSRHYRMKELREYAYLATQQVHERACILEIASGPGYFATELAKLGNYKIFGLDISNDFVNIARRNAQQAGVEVDFRQGNASAIPLPDNAFDFTFCSWSFKNFKEPLKVLKEMYRVLKPGGKAWIVDLNHDVTGSEWNRYASERGIRGATAWFMRLAFCIQKSGAYSRSELSEFIQNTSFERCELQAVGINLYIHLFK